MTAASASFVHGANDVANGIGPYASIYQIWQTSNIPGAKSAVPIWILAFGGAAIVIGLWTYGYNIMRNLGNRVTLMSPVRGFSMELGYNDQSHALRLLQVDLLLCSTWFLLVNLFHPTNIPDYMLPAIL
jgi:phosphate/sulfate permease